MGSLRPYTAIALLTTVALATILPFSTPASAVDCNDDTVCDADDDCSPSMDQGGSDARADGAYGGAPIYTVTATAAAVAPERWIRTTCSYVTLTARVNGDAETRISGTGCPTPICAATASYDVWVEDKSAGQGAFCDALASESCIDGTVAGAAASHSFSVSVPNTEVTTKNCAYATLYEDTNGNGSWSDDDPIQSRSQCAPTNVKVGAAPL